MIIVIMAEVRQVYVFRWQGYERKKCYFTANRYVTGAVTKGRAWQSSTIKT